MRKSILRQLIVLPLLMLLMAALYACGSAAGSRAAAPQRFTTTYVLAQGASTLIAPAAVRSNDAAATATAPALKLDRVNDSRCRQGAVCVWAGYISYSFSLTMPNGATSNFVLSDSMPNGSTSVTQHGLTITLLGVEPQAVPPKNDIIPDYRVSVSVSNAPAVQPTH